jgi:hypothetical protein
MRKAMTKPQLEAALERSRDENNRLLCDMRKRKLEDLAQVKQAIDAVVKLRGHCLVKESEALQLELPCTICLPLHSHNVAGKCERHGKRIAGLPVTTQADAEEEALTEILSKCEDVAAAVENAAEVDFEGEREAMLTALGMIEHEWNCIAHKYMS